MNNLNENSNMPASSMSSLNSRAVPSFSAQPFKLSSLSPDNSLEPMASDPSRARNSNSAGNSHIRPSGMASHGLASITSNDDNTVTAQWILNSFLDKAAAAQRMGQSHSNSVRDNLQDSNNEGNEDDQSSTRNGQDGLEEDMENVAGDQRQDNSLENSMIASNDSNEIEACDNIQENEDLLLEDKPQSDQIYQPPPIYPVLDPIIKEINYIPSILTAEFMEIYFSNTIYSIAPILRRYSMLSYDYPRKCSPALLYSILYVSAHASNHPIMTSGSQYKPMFIAKLLESTMAYLQPLRNEYSSDHEVDLDDVIAYINIGIVDNASDFKPSSMKWWTMAVTLARSLKLNKEIPAIPEEAREERRRTWWSLFMIDRHLALCFNRPCMILDSECLELFFPISKDLWDSGVAVPPSQSQQNGSINSHSHLQNHHDSSNIPDITSARSPERLYPPEEDRNRRRGLQCTVVEAGIFGMYLPLMTLLGGIIELHFFELSPLFSQLGDGFLQQLRDSYKNRLKAFQYSLEEFYSVVDTRNAYLMAWGEYCECAIQVFYILLQGFWDPTDMLDDIDVLLNDSKFNSCLRHSISASTHVERILRLDPELQLIPFFFGIQLLQAGFIPFCMSERYGSHTSTDVAQACELFVRAHEVSIATLSTQYQVNFRSLLHGVIRDMKHTTVSVNERILSTNRRRILMSMYRWNSGGTGLAV